MANLNSQAVAIRDLLVERLELFDPTLETAESSPLWSQVIQPVFEALGTDPFDTDIDSFLRDRLRQEFPDVSVTDGDAIVDLLVRPLQLLLEAMKRETQIIRRGQSVQNADTMRVEDAEALAANFFVTRRVGARATGIVRVFYASPTFVNVQSTVSFSTTDGLRFFPIRPQFFPADVVLLQRSGTLYYVDVSVIAEDVGEEYNVGAGVISRVNGLPSVARISNPSAFIGGAGEETARELLDRTGQSLTERSLNTRRGISARLFRDFPTLRNIEVVGYGDPEMNRDIITGGGQGRVIASGTCFIVGQFCLMFSQYEDRGFDGSVAMNVGDEIELNYWRFLYDVEPEDSHEVFTIENILFDTRELFTEDLPSVVLMQLSGVPSAAPPIALTLPGVLPGVFSVVRTKGVIEISDIPGGILNPDTPRGTILIEDNEIHVGGHYDVWARNTTDVEVTTDPGVARSESAFLEADDLFTTGLSPRLQNQLHRRYVIEYSPLLGDLQIGEPIESEQNLATATILEKTATHLVVGEFGPIPFEVGNTILGKWTDAQATIVSIESEDWYEDGVRPGMLMSIINGNDAGVYKILKVQGEFLYVDVDLTETAGDLNFRIISEVTSEIFNPKEVLLPFGPDKGEDLATVIGSAIVKTGSDLLSLGIEAGDSLEILEGDDQGVYAITGFDGSLGGRAPVLSTPMTSSDSGLRFRVFRPGEPLSAPLVRIQPGGVKILDPSGQDSGSVLPYALPVEGRALEAFAGAGSTALGRNGFVLADPGPAWEPTGDLIGDPEDFEDVKLCFSEDCLPCENGYIAVVTFLDDGSFYLDSNIPAEAQQFLQDLRQWVVDVIEAFELGDDFQAFVDGFHPLILGPPGDALLTTNILHQAEICLPEELFDGCNNIFVALPEFDWENEFREGGLPFDVGTVQFNEVLDKWNSGELEGSGTPPALKGARPGDSLTVLSGANVGSYIIDRVHNYKLCHGGAIQDAGSELVADLDKCYDVAVAVIKGEFPVHPFAGLLEFFQNGVPELEVPLPPTFNVECVDLTTGDVVSPWEVFQSVLTWIFQWLNAMGFDLPDGVSLDPGPTLEAIWKLLFHEYVVGQPTCEQMVRLTFVEPTSFTAYGNRACESFEYNPPAAAIVELEGERITLPLPQLDGLDIEVTITDVLSTVVLSGTLGAAAAAATTLTDLATEIQNLLDPSFTFINVQGGGFATGALTVQTEKGGDNLVLSMKAETAADAWRWLGFYSESDGMWPRIWTEFTPTYNHNEVTIPAGGGSIDFRWETTLGGVNTGSVVFPAGTHTWDDIIAIMEAQLLLLINPTLGGGSAGFLAVTVSIFPTVGGTFLLQVDATIGGGTDTWVIVGLDVLQPLVGTVGTDVFADVWGPGFIHGSLSATNIVIDSIFGQTIPRGTANFSLLLNGADLISKSFADFLEWRTSGVSDALEALKGLGSDRADEMAAVLNSLADLTDFGGSPRVQFVGGDYIEIRAIEEGTGETLLVAAPEPIGTSDDGFSSIGFLAAEALSDSPITGVPGANLEVTGLEGGIADGEGAIGPGPLVREFYNPPEPTLFSAVTGAAELLFVASSNVEPFQVFPGETTNGRVPPTELTRDVVPAEDYDGATSNVLRFEDVFRPSPVAAGVQGLSDELWLYEQRVFLEHTIFDAEIDLVKDRVIAVTTTFGSNVIKLPPAPEPDFNFQDSTTDLLEDEVQVGDIVFIEEGEDAGGYTVIARDDFQITLDKVMTESSGIVFKSGNDGIIEADTVVLKSETANFVDEDVGRYLTIWATNRPEYDGSYRILSVTDLGTDTEVELDTDNFPQVEQEIHWAVVKAPTEDPPASGTEGRTALVGVRPIRVYNGDPKKLRVANVSGHLERTRAEVLVVHEAGSPPKTGNKQPYQIVRPGLHHTSSSAMKGQGRELGLYYTDVLAMSLGGDAIHNLPEGTRMEPVFGTYDFEGYRLEVDDPNLVYSPQEQTTMVITPQILPTGFNDTVANHVAMEGRQLRITYDFAPVIDQVQRLLSSEADRILCANPLARSFMPSYVYFDVNVSGGNTQAKIAGDIIDAIEALEPVDDLDVSKLEKVLNNNSVIRYDHPVQVIIVTHDLDRRLVGFRSVNKIGEDEVVFNGSNRTTFFIAGPDTSGFENEGSIPDGERTYIIRGVPTTTLR
jgi:hypothetical protein